MPSGVVVSGIDRLIHAQASTTVWRQVDRSWRMLSALETFEKTIAVDQFPDLPPDRFNAIQQLAALFADLQPFVSVQTTLQFVPINAAHDA